jgi:cyclopropane fatty-acyl-phospholipid synthase-like methyltransferase
MDNDFHVPADWYQTFFTAPVNSFWEKMVPPEATEADLGFLSNHLATEPPARILDMPCGAGRHALGLARLGYDVTGVDLSEDAVAQASATANDATLPARFVRGDMRRFEADEPFDALVCFGNSISYFDQDGMQAFLGTLAACVRKSGRLLLDTYCCAESIFPLQDERILEFEGGTYSSRFRYDAFASALSTAAGLRLGDEVHSLLYTHHVVTSGALVRSLGEAGFEAITLYADTDDAPFAPGSPRLLLVARRE